MELLPSSPPVRMPYSTAAHASASAHGSRGGSAMARAGLGAEGAFAGAGVCWERGAEIGGENVCLSTLQHGPTPSSHLATLPRPLLNQNGSGAPVTVIL